MSRSHSLRESFRYALSGLKLAIRKEPNFRIHLVTAALAFILAYFLNFSLFEWLTVILVSTIVMVVELINTVLESLVNLVSPGIHDEAKIAKDVAAAAVFVSAAASVVVGVILYLPKILTLFI